MIRLYYKLGTMIRALYRKQRLLIVRYPNNSFSRRYYRLSFQQIPIQCGQKGPSIGAYILYTTLAINLALTKTYLVTPISTRASLVEIQSLLNTIEVRIRKGRPPIQFIILSSSAYSSNRLFITLGQETSSPRVPSFPTQCYLYRL